ncbi:GIY-YIG nuclease family protein [Guyparkeria sp.]|uniref:GIY-YIG nuclease family protein n=1 Tax=Guyparkeria sp. TaxID=2035736 RepID=UPI003970C969
MNPGRSIRLFLVDGQPNGLMTAEIMNWTGHVITGPRTKLKELVQRPECDRTGIYFLVGPDPDNSLRPLVYIGETDNVGTRLQQHNKPEDKGGKDFWERACVITSKDANLTKAHVKYLESLLIRDANEIGRCKLRNGTNHEYINLPESDKADMAFFAEQVRTVLPVLGFDFLRERPVPSGKNKKQAPSADAESPRFVAEVPKYGIKALGQEVNGDFFVFKGSSAREDWVGVDDGYQGLYHQLREDGVLVKGEGGLCRFATDYAFSSPSAAAAVVSGRSANGRVHWKDESTGQTYGEWQDQQVSQVTSEGEAEQEQ